MNYVKVKKPIFSFTIKELLDNRDGDFIHHDKYTQELQSPVLKYCYANTLRFEIKSSKFGQKVKMKNGRTGTNITKYDVFVLFEDFYTIGKDKDISLEDAIDFAVGFGDIHLRCTCPAATYWGYNYIQTEFKTLYGIPREKRFPIIRNPNLKGTICKHEDAVLQYIQRNKALIAKMFAEYYNRLNEGQSIYAVNTNGTTITIGHKEGDNDVFFDQQVKETENEESEEEEMKELNEEVSENEETNLMEDEVQDDSEWHIEDPTEGVVWDEDEE